LCAYAVPLSSLHVYVCVCACARAGGPGLSGRAAWGQFFVTALERYYPETLAFVLVYNAPWVFQPFWRIISPWLDDVVREKARRLLRLASGPAGAHAHVHVERGQIVFISTADELFERIPRQNLPRVFGGDLPDVVHPIRPSTYYPQHFPHLRGLPDIVLRTTLLPGAHRDGRAHWRRRRALV
jgi:hypothetical protein